MLDRFASLAHLFGMLVEAALHGFEHMLMLPSGNASLFSGGATMLDGAALTDVGQITVQHQTVFLGCK
jgi:hypothetical protein